MRRDDTLVERRVLVVAVVMGVVGAFAVLATGHPAIGLALFAAALVCVAVQYARGHSS